ncbi:acyl carrier protein [Streptomyces sp. GS7]|uniref:acyl carrier protein n=1 Tax=Streptomyces sp. GS7 TaxID=2692234 RepID=UPI00131871C2|nr:phosphopantetheine-binding protein [Streptomyces sp. GS7]QHC22680.1 acyl carrier protein [Streptomyces sp. GS7]
MDDVLQHLMTVLTEKFDVPADAIRADSTLTDLDLDSLAVVEFAVTLQDHWHIDLDDDAAAEATLDDLAGTVRGLLGEQSGTPAP